MPKDPFDEKLESVKGYYNNLMATTPVSPNIILSDHRFPRSLSGVYVFSELSGDAESFLYVGQANGILERLHEHCATKGHKKANFAYKLTSETTGLRPIPGSPNSTKESMFDIPEFDREFASSITRIKGMNYRWVETSDKLEKNLLEIYVAVTLQSRFNDFD